MRALEEAACQLEGALKATAEEAGKRLVDAPVRELLRAVGENVVREVLWLPRAAAAMRERLRLEDEQMASKHEIEIEIELGATPTDSGHPLPCQPVPPGLGAEHLTQSGCTQAISLDHGHWAEHLDAIKQRHAVERRAAAYRATAAEDAWRGHLENAATKLALHDERLLTEKAAAFWTQVGSTREKLCTEVGADWARKRLVDDDLVVISTILRDLEGVPRLKRLLLSCNAISGEGLTTLADATRFGALSHLEWLYIDNNQVDDAGMVELAGALASGSLARLVFLDANRNHIGDQGAAALAGAIAKGALANLQTLYMHSNRIGDAGAVALAQSLSSGRVGGFAAAAIAGSSAMAEICGGDPREICGDPREICGDVPPLMATLAPGWEAHEDEETGALYFFRAETGETSWEMPRGVVLAKLEKLWLYNNLMGSAGVAALTAAADAALPALKSLDLVGNQAKQVAEKHFGGWRDRGPYAHGVDQL